MSDVINVCLFENELLSAEVYRCTENGCSSIFRKISNFELHRVKHHGIGSLNPKSKGVTMRFFCPKLDCMYNINHMKNKSFTQKRLLKQHFMKVHAPKIYTCEKCGLQSSLSSLHKRHVKSCGTKFSCGTCGWEYNNNESFLVHLKRKHPEVHQAHIKNNWCKKNAKKAEINNQKNTFNGSKTSDNIIFNLDTFNQRNGYPEKYLVTKSNPLYFQQDNSIIISDVIKFEHNYSKSIHLQENNAEKLNKNNMAMINVISLSSNSNGSHQIVQTTNDLSCSLIPLNLLNKDHYYKKQNLIDINERSEMKQNISIITQTDTSSRSIKSTSADQCTQTSLKFSKKSKFSKVDKLSVETQTFNNSWNPSTEKNKSKCKNTCTQSFISIAKHEPKTNSKIAKNKKKHLIEPNSKSGEKITYKTSQNISSEIDILKDENLISSSLRVSDTVGDLSNEYTLDSSHEVKEHSNVFLSDSTSKPISKSNSINFNCQFDCEDIATQSSDIETQTALDELLYSNTPKCDDIQDDIFSELIHLSDIQTQTNWPLSSYDVEKCLESEMNFNDDRNSAILKSTETQTMDVLDDNNPFFSTYNYEMEKNSPLFDDTSSHFCFKETQTCFCYLDSLRCEDSMNVKIMNEMDSSNNSQIQDQILNNFTMKESSCMLTSAETQTQFPFDNSQFFSRKTDVLLSCCTTETQTCFEDSYLDNVMDMNHNKDI